MLRLTHARPAMVGVAGALMVALAAGRLSTVLPASADHDGPPTVTRTWPQAGATAGGTAVRIYGQGLDGAAEVTFGGEAALDFRILDSNLITAVVPPAAGGSSSDNTLVDVAVTDDEDTGTTDEDAAFLYTDALLTVSPDEGLEPGDATTVALAGYEPAKSTLVVEANPLGGFLENGPTPPAGPDPYEDHLADATTDEDGNVTTEVELADPFDADTDYDANATCPPTQDAADAGITRCAIAVKQFGPAGEGPGVGALVRSFGLSDDPEPAEPTLTVSGSTGEEGETVTLDGANWNGAALFGSDLTPDDPGETELSVEICTADLDECDAPESEAEVALTRYRDGDPGDATVQGELSGATLSGSLTVGDTSGCAPDCVVRVTQERAELDGGVADGEPLSATAPLIGGGADDQPEILRTWPDTSPTDGGVAVRIYGNGFDGATEVTFGGEAAEELTVVDSTLITAVVPPAEGGEDDDNTTVDVAVTVDAATGTTGPLAAFLYTDATLDVSPDTGLTPGARTAVDVSGYAPSSATSIRQASPLAGFAEGEPPGARRYSRWLASASTDDDGDSSSAVSLSVPFATEVQQRYDPNIVCPVTRPMANAGLPNCAIHYAGPGGGTLERSIAQAGRPVPAAPNVTLSSLSAFEGQRIDLGGVNWSAAAAFGSAVEPDDPGQSLLDVDICTTDFTECRSPNSDATVPMTRYIDGDPDDDETVEGVFTGADLEGSFSVQEEEAELCTPECVVRVRQQRFDPERRAPVDEFIEATTILSFPPPVTSENFYNYDPFSGVAGTRVAFYGNGANGITSVTFDGVPGTGLIVEEDALTSVLVPEGPTGLVDMVVFGGPSGTIEFEEGFFIIPPDFTYAVSVVRDGEAIPVAIREAGEERVVEPVVPVRPGETIRVEVENYAPNGTPFMVLISPLINYVEPLPGADLPTIPHQVNPLFQSLPSTDENGDFTGEVVLPTGPFSNGDPNAQCPVTQEQANVGLPGCRLTVTLTAPGVVSALVELPLPFVGEPVAQSPTLETGADRVQPGDRVGLSGENWSGQPQLGASTQDDSLVVELCGLGGDPAACVSAEGSVARTRYRYDGSDKSSGQLSGGELSATVTVPADAGPCDCVVRVRQRQGQSDEFLVAAASLVVTTASIDPPPTDELDPPGLPGGTAPPLPVAPAGAIPPTQPAPPPVPPGGTGVAPSATPTPTPAPTPVGSPVATPGAAGNPGAADVEEQEVEAAGASRHLMARHERGDERSAFLAQGAVALAAAGVGCVMVLGGSGIGRRRSAGVSARSRQGRPRPKGAY